MDQQVNKDEKINFLIEKIINNQHTNAELLELKQLITSTNLQIAKYITNIGEGKDVHIGDRTYHGVDAEKLQEILGKSTLDKNSFLGIIQWIRQTSGYIENLDIIQGREIRDIVLKIKANNDLFDFTQFEIQVFELVFNYYHYHLRGKLLCSPELREQKLKKPNDFYKYADKMVKSGQKIRQGSVNLSSIIKDNTMSKLIKDMEQC